MTDHNAIVDDGVITIPLDGDAEMADVLVIDLAPNVANLLLTETTGNLQASNRNSRGVMDTVAGTVAGTVGTNFAEVGVLESRAVSGTLATPIASPTTGA